MLGVQRTPLTRIRRCARPRERCGACSRRKRCATGYRRLLIRVATASLRLSNVLVVFGTRCQLSLCLQAISRFVDVLLLRAKIMIRRPQYFTSICDRLPLAWSDAVGCSEELRQSSCIVGFHGSTQQKGKLKTAPVELNEPLYDKNRIFFSVHVAVRGPFVSETPVTGPHPVGQFHTVIQDSKFFYDSNTCLGVCALTNNATKVCLASSATRCHGALVLVSRRT